MRRGVIKRRKRWCKCPGGVKLCAIENGRHVAWVGHCRRSHLCVCIPQVHTGELVDPVSCGGALMCDNRGAGRRRHGQVWRLLLSSEPGKTGARSRGAGSHHRTRSAESIMTKLAERRSSHDRVHVIIILEACEGLIGAIHIGTLGPECLIRASQPASCNRLPEKTPPTPCELPGTPFTMRSCWSDLSRSTWLTRPLAPFDGPQRLSAMTLTGGVGRRVERQRESISGPQTTLEVGNVQISLMGTIGVKHQSVAKSRGSSGVTVARPRMTKG